MEIKIVQLFYYINYSFLINNINDTFLFTFINNNSIEEKIKMFLLIKNKLGHFMEINNFVLLNAYSNDLIDIIKCAKIITDCFLHLHDNLVSNIKELYFEHKIFFYYWYSACIDKYINSIKQAYDNLNKYYYIYIYMDKINKNNYYQSKIKIMNETLFKFRRNLIKDKIKLKLEKFLLIRELNTKLLTYYDNNQVD